MRLKTVLIHRTCTGFEYIPQVGHPLVKTTGIKDTVDAVSFDLNLLLPQSRVLVLCIIAAASLASCHEAVLGPGPRPESLSDRAFFASTPDLRSCGVRRAAAYRALRSKAIKAAWEIGVILESTEENALSCFLLDLLEQSACSILLAPTCRFLSSDNLVQAIRAVHRGPGRTHIYRTSGRWRPDGEQANIPRPTKGGGVGSSYVFCTAPFPRFD